MPKHNREYWERKIGRNRARDLESLDRLHELGWDGLVIWECEIGSLNLVQLKEFLG